MTKRAGNLTSPGGCLRFDRVFRGVGRIQRSSGTRKRTEFNRRDGILTKLHENSQLEALRAVQRGDLSLEELVMIDRQNRLGQADALMALNRRLWIEVDAVWPAKTLTVTSKRYRTSLAALQKKLGRGETRMTIQQLQKLNWPGLFRSWGKSPTDWNHMRRAVSAMLTLVLKDPDHPFRKELMKKIPVAKEHGRVPELTVQAFWKVVSKLPEHAKPGIITLAATGMRVSEYLHCTKGHLRPGIFGVQVPGTKTEESAAVIRVAEWLWPWVVKAIPAPIGHNWLRKYWYRACKAAKAPPTTLHDLRHCYGQWAVEGGANESDVQTALRHTSLNMTRRYTKQKEKGNAAAAVGKVMQSASKRLGRARPRRVRVK